MREKLRFASIFALGLLLLTDSPAHASDWSNLGGTDARDGRASVPGPESATLRWQGAATGLIAWNPCTEGNRLFTVRQTGFVPNGVPNESPVHAMSISTGAPLWTFHCPYETGDWTTVVYGVRNGRVFVGRGGNGGSVAARVHCLDAATGALLWVSADEVATGAYDGIVFADDGDPIFAWHLSIRRIDAATGATVWSTARNCSVSGDCGPARSASALYIDEVGPGGQVITALDLETGARRYSGPVMPGFTSQNTPMCGPNGLVFYARTQSNPTVDYLYAFRDTGKQLVQLWKAPALGGAGSNHGLTADGGIVMVSYAGKLQVRDQETGALRFESASTVTAQTTQSHVAVDSFGRIFYGNGGFPGTVYSFNPDLTQRWSLAVSNLNQAGPVLAGDGSMLLATTAGVRSYFDPPACAPADLNCDGAVNAADLSALLLGWGTAAGDVTGDGTTNAADITALLLAWG